MILSLAQRAALADCAPTLKRVGNRWRRSPSTARNSHNVTTVLSLVANGLVAYGNRARSFVVVTEAGRAAGKEAA